MMWVLYGLGLDWGDQLPWRVSSGAPSFGVYRRGRIDWPSSALRLHKASDPGGTTIVEVAEDRYRITYAEVDVRFDARRNLFMTSGPTEAVCALLERAAVPVFLSLVRPELCLLHGACVGRDDTALGLLGSTGAGKSSSAHGLRAHGFRALADDVLFVQPGESGAQVIPAGGFARLRGGDEGELERFTGKRRVFHGDTSGPVRLEGVIVLHRGSDEISLRRLDPLHAMHRILDATFVLRPGTDRQRRERLRRARTITELVPAWELRFPEDPSGLPVHLGPFLELWERRLVHPA